MEAWREEGGTAKRPNAGKREREREREREPGRKSREGGEWHGSGRKAGGEEERVVRGRGR